jgi:hypothetical protein
MYLMNALIFRKENILRMGGKLKMTRKRIKVCIHFILIEITCCVFTSSSLTGKKICLIIYGRAQR